MSVTVADDGAVRLIAFDRPHKLNAFDRELYSATGNALREAAADDSVNVVVLTGNGRAFSAGQDLAEMAALAAGTDTGGSGFPVLLDEVQSFPKPLVAAVNGLAVGIGLTLLPHCDLVLVDETARLRVPFSELGVPPEAASSLLLPARLGWQHAARLLFTSEWITAHEAVSLGLALDTCPAGTVVEHALALAARIAAFPLPALRAIKTTMLAAQLPAVREARRIEDQAFATIFAARRTTP